MKHLIMASLLLFTAFSALSDPLISCQPASFFAVVRSQWLLSIITLSCFALALYTRFAERDRRAVWPVALVIGGALAGGQFILAPKTLPVVNESAILSQPGVTKGHHYLNECVQAWLNDTTITLSCQPDAQSISLPLAEYDAAVAAFQSANSKIRTLERKLAENNICRTE